MRKAIVTTLLAAAGLAAAGAACAQEFAVKGLLLGAARAALNTHFGPIECVRPPAQFTRLGDEVCTPRPCAGSDCTAGQQLLVSYANQPIWRAGFGMVNGRFEQFKATMSASSYEAVRNALRDVYGAGSESTETRQTLGGARLASRVWQVEGQGWQATIVERGAAADEGAVDIRSSTFSRWVAAGGTAQKKAGDL